jgi:hypothetical protein
MVFPVKNSAVRYKELRSCPVLNDGLDGPRQRGIVAIPRHWRDFLGAFKVGGERMVN